MDRMRKRKNEKQKRLESERTVSCSDRKRQIVGKCGNEKRNEKKE